MRLVHALVFPIAAASCQIIVGVRERQLVEGGDAPDAAPACVADLRNDPNNCGFCGHACEACLDGFCPTTDIVNVIGPHAFVVDDAHIYVSAADGVYVYAKDGTPERAWLGPTAQDVRAQDENAYFIVRPDDIFVGFVDGGSQHLYGDDASIAAELAVDPAHVFWVTKNDGVRSMALDGAQPIEIVKEDKTNSRSQISVDEGTVYAWTRSGGIVRFPPDAGPDASVELLVGNQFQIDTFTRSGAWLYYAHNLLSGEESFDRQSLDGGATEHVMTTPDSVSRMKASGDRIYAVLFGTTPNDGRVIVFDQTANLPNVLAEKQPGVAGIAIDDRYVYWMTGITTDAGNQPGTIRRVRK